MTVGDRGRVKPRSGLNLRAKPNGEKIAVLAHNEEVEILEEVTFFRVRGAAGRIGYVHGAYVEKMPAAEMLDRAVAVGNAIPTETFKLVTFINECFVGEVVRVDRDFVPALERVAHYARDNALKVWTTSSVRSINNQVRGAIVPPASRSCHHIGHAIDMNLLHDGKLYNSKKLRRGNLNRLPQAIRHFIDAIRADEGLRWGGDFHVEDPVHIDDDFFRKQEVLYMAKLHSRIAQLNA